MEVVVRAKAVLVAVMEEATAVPEGEATVEAEEGATAVAKGAEGAAVMEAKGTAGLSTP